MYLTHYNVFINDAEQQNHLNLMNADSNVNSSFYWLQTVWDFFSFLQ